jgi:hypothetical protein
MVMTRNRQRSDFTPNVQCVTAYPGNKIPNLDRACNGKREREREKEICEEDHVETGSPPSARESQITSLSVDCILNKFSLLQNNIVLLREIERERE